MATNKKNPGNLVFGLDIGTRSVVGTVGYRTDETFHVIAQESRQHDTRSMLDGQIHDIDRVGRTIADVKDEIERKINRQLNEVCIAAAGRVLKTVTTSAEIEYEEDIVVDAEQIYTLDMLGIEKAYDEFHSNNDSDVKFYCVGYTVVKYYVNGMPMSAPDKHKARKLSVDLIATFLPDDVVDGLYKAVEIADLTVANLTLEPIAAMQAAVPQMYRMLNIALVDVGAGTSDISITKDGSIIAYGMIPKAGDELTEAIAQALLLDFNMAERVKTKVIENETIRYEDIMGISHSIEPQEVLKIVENVIEDMTTDIAEKIKELNADKSVSAVFVVGGGGKIPTFTEKIAEKLGIISERVALRGKEVLKDIDYQIENPVIDSMYVTPVGICLNFYDQKNNFIFVNFNGKRIKLYDNGHLTVADAAMQAEFPNEGLFPRRGRELHYTLNGKPYMVRGKLGEPAVIKLNDEIVSLNSPIVAGDKIKVSESTPGEDASLEIKNLKEFGGKILVVVNDKTIELPQFSSVNGELQSEYYSIKDGDDIKMLNYYSVKQIAEFMDVTINPEYNIYVNNKISSLDTLVYENFNVIWTLEKLNLSDVTDTDFENEEIEFSKYLTKTTETEDNSISIENEESSTGNETEKYMTVFVNGEEIHLKGKDEYILVDVFDYIDFNLSKPEGRSVATKVNGQSALFAQTLNPLDKLEIYWEK
ncbi:MAG: cell division FtsA domain-containing protein [Lachnospiraceae bacterium]|nr:rod shape-determining protein [Lachnospiraceae bacterium]MDY4836893.1 cell division FtsA domain-containing protein [Lachnospiraceae bacterium]